jgi:hypothetical protein
VTWLGVAAFLILLQRGRVTATVFADELTYGRLAENIGHGLGKTFHGLPSSQRTLYPYLVAPAWALFDGVTAYRVALAINALAMTSVILPAFGIARTVTRFRTALATAVLVALVPSMVWSGMLMTESLAYPAAGVFLFATLLALRRPGLGTALVAGICVVAGYFARSQFISLGGVFAIAIVLEILRHGRAGIVPQLRRHKWVVLGAGLLGGAGGLVVLARPDLVGGYSCVLRNPPGPIELGTPALDYLGTTMIACALAPAIALIALAVTPRAWRDDRSGPLLCVAIAAAGGLLFQAAWTAVTTSPELQERYVFYAAPAVLPALALLPGRVRPRTLLAVTGVLTLYCALIFPGFSSVTGEVIVNRLGLTGPLADVLSDQRVLWAGATAVLGAGLALGLRAGATRAVTVALALTAVFTVPVLGARQLDANRQSAEQALRFQRPLTVVDDIAGTRRAALIITRGASLAGGFQVQLWNDSVDRVFRVGTTDTIGVGQACPVLVAADGTLSPKALCSGLGLPPVLVLEDGNGERLQPANGRVRRVGQGLRVWEVPSGEAPRLALRGVAGGAESLALPPDPVPGTGPAGRCNGT